MNAKYTIGYIDEDDTQVKTYRRKLKKHGFDVIGYEFEKGMTLKDLMKQVYLSDIDLLMIDYKLNDTNVVSFNGEEVEREIYETKPKFPHIVFTNKVDQAEPFIEDWKIIFDKEVVFGDDERIERFVTILEKSIEQYRNYVFKKKQQIAALLEKESESGLNAREKDALLLAQEELYIMDKSKIREVPKQIISFDKLEELSKTRKEAEFFLKMLIEKNKNK